MPTAFAFAVHERGEQMRDRIMSLIAHEPGVHMARAARILGIRPSTLDFHVRKLARAEQIQLAQDGKTVHMFPPDAPEDELQWRSLLADPEAKAIAAVLARRGQCGIQDVSRILGQSRKVVRKHMLRMSDVGLLHRGEGHHGKFSPGDSLMEAIRDDPREAHDTADSMEHVPVDWSRDRLKRPTSSD